MLNRRSFLSPESVTTAWRWSANNPRERKQAWNSTTPVGAHENASKGEAVPECLRNRAPPPPKRNAITTKDDVAWPRCWIRHQSLWKNDPNVGRRIEVEVHPPWQWNARERVLIESMEAYLKGSGSFNLAISDFEHFLLSPMDEAISIMFFSGNACDEHVDERNMQCWRRSEAWKRRRYGASSGLLETVERK